MDNSDQINFIMAIVDLVLAIIGFVILVFTDNSPMSGILFILPCIKENLEALTKEKNKLPKFMIIMNFVTLIASIVIIVLFVVTALAVMEANIVAACLSLILPLKYAIYVGYYYDKY